MTSQIKDDSLVKLRTHNLVLVSPHPVVYPAAPLAPFGCHQVMSPRSHPPGQLQWEQVTLPVTGCILAMHIDWHGAWCDRVTQRFGGISLVRIL